MHSANGTHEIYALKRVPLDKIDSETVAGYMNEIRLLRRLSDNARIIRLIDSEVKQPSPNQKGNLMLVMELGEIDLAKLLYQQQKEPLDPVWIAYYWKQMLQAVHVIHEEKIVHSDLKPANFVLVRGQLKLIDFGIANAIANDTTNIQRDHQIGTVNYMSPEAIELPDGMRRLKVGRPSDVWSLGCILYQMVYGQPPFQALSVVHKMRAIPDEDHVIEYPEYAVPIVPRGQEPPPEGEEIKVRVPQSIINTMKSCLIRNPKARSTIPELLLQNWLERESPNVSHPEVPSVPAPPPPSPPPPPPAPSRELLLRDDETIINPHYMMQLLTYGLQLGWQREELTQEELMGKAEVRATFVSIPLEDSSGGVQSLVRELKQINIDTAR
ncbi:kinase-like domain-containing protein [Trametes elegans]|nr:kinase-like domain-containing protein [Trametes elegans]